MSEQEPYLEALERGIRAKWEADLASDAERLQELMKGFPPSYVAPTPTRWERLRFRVAVLWLEARSRVALWICPELELGEEWEE